MTAVKLGGPESAPVTVELKVEVGPCIDAATGVACGCTHDIFGPAPQDPRDVVPNDKMPAEVMLIWRFDLRRARAGEHVVGQYGFGFKLCARHRAERLKIPMEIIDAGVDKTLALRSVVRR